MTTNIYTHLVFSALITALMAIPLPVRAEDCVTQYGGYTAPCPPTDLTINKQVQNPVSDIFVENLGSTDATFSPGSNVTYRLQITNASGETFETVTIKDMLAEQITFVAGPGTYDQASNTLTITEKSMIAGETRNIEFVAKVKETGLPDTNFFCFTNKANVNAQGRYDEDTADACVQTHILTQTTLPVAGFNDLLVMLPFAGLGLTGVALLRHPELITGKKQRA